MSARAQISATGHHPSGDKRFRRLEATMKRHQCAQDALIEVLHQAQELFGYLDCSKFKTAFQPSLWSRPLLSLLLKTESVWGLPVMSKELPYSLL